MRKYGFKIFNTNLQTAPALIGECAAFAKGKDDIFVELMVTADASEADLQHIRQLLDDTQVRIHAPHHVMGFDAGNKSKEKQNREILAAAQRAADIFKAKTIVVHAGCGHNKENINETVRQFKLFNDARIVVENLPFMDDHDNTLLQGNTAAEIKYIMDEVGCGFCLDFSHAICAALSLNMDIERQLQDFYALQPSVYHLCDGDIAQAEDVHWHYGEGNYPLQHFLHDLTASDAYITMETGYGVPQHNDLWVKDYNYLKSL